MSKTKKEKKSYKIGSAGLGKLNFDQKDHFFHQDDNLQKIKRDVKDFVDPDILGLKRPGWNTSSAVDPGPRPDQKKHLFDVKPPLN